jgi:hypothetical protein
MAETLITAAKTAATSTKFDVRPEDAPVVVTSWGFSGTDAIDVQFSYDGGTTFVDMYEDGVQTQLSATNNIEAFYAPGIYRLNKGVTTGTVGAALSRKNNL